MLDGRLRRGENIMDVNIFLERIKGFYNEKDISDIIKPLYHYTTINSFARIISSKTLRFNSLKCVDDLIEGRSKDLGDLRKYFFVSCWTSQVEESIPFWKMYTENMKGIRIGLKKYPFEIHSFNFQPKNIKIEYPVSFVPEEYLLSDKYIIFPNNKILQKVEYTDDENKLFPRNIDQSVDEMFAYNLGNIGKYKNTAWSFQSEYRYLIGVYPGTGVMQLDEDIRNAGKIKYSLDNNLDINTDSMFLNLTIEALNSMEIIMGPKNDEGDKIIIESLIEKYLPGSGIKVKTSSLQDKIK